jgi:SWI/SNF-related matrix-associated actin-dependent regulator of chromatin subfamily A3
MQGGSGGAKLNQLIEQLQANEAASRDQPGLPIKAVVFSQFRTMLSLVEARLHAEGIPHVRVDGSVSSAQRTTRLDAFASAAAESPRVAVVSLKACGVGLNLVAASQVHLLDPWWNPMTEDQAMDRVHRIGQRLPVRVFRYISRGTIEERMLDLQNRKRELLERAFERRRPEDQQAARLADIKLLMSL